MSLWLSHVLMHQKGLKKAQLGACTVITLLESCASEFPRLPGGPGGNLLSLTCDLASGSRFCPWEAGGWPQLDVGVAGVYGGPF